MHNQDTGHFATNTCFLFNFISGILFWCTNVTQKPEEYMHAYTKQQNKKTEKNMLSQAWGHKSSDTHTHIQYPNALQLVLMVAGEKLAWKVSLERQRKASVGEIDRTGVHK